MAYYTPKILNHLYQDGAHIGASLIAATMTLRNEPYISDFISSMFSSKMATTTSSKTIFSNLKNAFSYASKNAQHTSTETFAQKVSADAITDISFPLISTVASFTLSKHQYSLFEKNYAATFFTGIIASKALSIYSCLISPARSIQNKSLITTKNLLDLTKALVVDIEFAIPHMKHVNEIANSKTMSTHDKIIAIATEEVMVIGASLGADAAIDVIP